MKLNGLKLLKRWIGLGALVLSLFIGATALNAADTNATTVAGTTTNVAFMVKGQPLVVTNTILTFGLDHVPALQPHVMGKPIWQYIAALIYIVLAFYVSKILDWLIHVQLRKITERTETKLDDLLLELLRGPVKVVTFVILLHIGLELFPWGDRVNVFISNGLKIVVAASLTYVALKIVDMLMGVWQQRMEASGEALLDMHLLPIIRKTLKVFLVIVAVLVALDNMHVEVKGLLASLSIGGLAVGLAAQDTLSNLFGAVALFADKPFRVGEQIKLEAIEGTVEAIGLRSTKIRNLDGHLVTVPNRTMANASLTNVSRRPNIKTVMNIGVTYDTPSEKIERAMAIIKEVYQPHPKTADLIVSFNKFADSALNILVVHWWNSKDFKEYLMEFQKLNLELKRRFDKEGINFAFPSQTVYLKQDSEWRLAGLQGEPSRN
jgi:MscS family membrane protein